MISVFLDSSVYYAGFHDQKGMSGLVFTLARKDNLVVYATRFVLLEADANLRYEASARAEFHQFLRQSKPKVIPEPPHSKIDPWRTQLGPRCARILASAIAARTFLFLTLDRKNFLDRKEKLEAPLRILSPREVLQS